MFQVYVFQSTYDGKPTACIREVEPVEWQGQVMYRDLHTGRVGPTYSEDGERVFDTRLEAVAAAVEGLQKLAHDYTAMCREQIEKVQR